MNNAFKFIFGLMICLLLGWGTLLAQTGDYALTWNGIGVGGGVISGGDYSLANAIGQPEAGPAQSGGEYSLTGGVVDAGEAGGVTPAGQRVYLPVVTR